ncbi:molybdopterin-dependent oxidoreductase [Desulfosporosinus sp. FKB]|uniref:molybdopterin-dependent oxidoreductase n=1 Tax=Desulfosporosinus sp. FKB TaxID=1969835 RepID=UPI000B4A216C|nr:molybdopterin-dependent oxidoreductase [Desulfosporosinus sp. FKB]
MPEKHYHVCPRNCYDTCSIISTTVNGVLVSIEGNPAHDYTKGKLCPKAMNDIQKVYNPSRIRYPMRQRQRFSGNWERMSWDEALDMIAQKIIDSKKHDGNTLSLALNKYSGNFGALHNAMEWLFSGMGPTTRAVGSPCWSAGVDAQTYDFGKFFCSEPREMGHAKLLWLWGVNPAWTAVHQMPIIFDAMDRGSKVICFDTYLSDTAARSHRFIQVKPGTDGLLALAMCKVLCEENLMDDKLYDYTLGLVEFIDYLTNSIDLTEAAEITGVKAEIIRELAIEYGQTCPACIWVGFGLQRYTNGGQTLRAIDALGALAGHIGEKGGGVHYGHFETWKFAGAGLPEQQNRQLNINRFAREALACDKPPLRVLWLSGRNPLAQDADLKHWHRLIQQLELIVINDLFLTKSAQAADIFLPATTHYEHWDLNSSYWHYWVGINEPAINPVGEAKSDLEIAWNLSAKLNRFEKGSCSFPTSGSERETALKQLGPDMLRMLGLNTPEEILDRPIKAKFPPTAWENHEFVTPSKRYEFQSSRALAAGLPALPVFEPALLPSKETPLRLLTPHHSMMINSQSYQDALSDYYDLYINPRLLENYGLKIGETAEIWNEYASLQVKVKVDMSLPEDVVIIYQQAIEQRAQARNALLNSNLSDMGDVAAGGKGLAINETFVSLRKLTPSERSF